MTDHIKAAQIILEDLRACKREQINLEEEAALVVQNPEGKLSHEYRELVDRNHRLSTHIDELQVQLEYHTGMVSLKVAQATIANSSLAHRQGVINEHEALPAEGYIIESKGQS